MKIASVSERFQIYYIVAEIEKRTRDLLRDRTSDDTIIGLINHINWISEKFIEMSNTVSLNWDSVMARLFNCSEALTRLAQLKVTLND
jgi:hypothetical protein